MKETLDFDGEEALDNCLACMYAAKILLVGKKIGGKRKKMLLQGHAVDEIDKAIKYCERMVAWQKAKRILMQPVGG